MCHSGLGDWDTCWPPNLTLLTRLRREAQVHVVDMIQALLYWHIRVSPHFPLYVWHSAACFWHCEDLCLGDWEHTLHCGVGCVYVNDKWTCKDQTDLLSFWRFSCTHHQFIRENKLQKPQQYHCAWYQHHQTTVIAVLRIVLHWSNSGQWWSYTVRHKKVPSRSISFLQDTSKGIASSKLKHCPIVHLKWVLKVQYIYFPRERSIFHFTFLCRKAKWKV